MTIQKLITLQEAKSIARHLASCAPATIARDVLENAEFF
jgi:hypothetical protein